MSENVLELLSIDFVNIKDGAPAICKTSHAFDVANNGLWGIASEDVPDEAHSVECLLELDLECDAVLLAVQQGSSGELLLMASRHECKGLSKSCFGITVREGDQFFGSVVEKVEKIRVDGLELLDTVSRGCSDDILRLWDTNFLELNTSLELDLLERKLVFHGPEGDTGSRLTSSRSTSRSVNISLDILWWLNLNDQINVGNIKTSRRNICSYKNRKLLLLKSLEGDLSLVLCDISVHNLNISLHFIRNQKLIGFSLGGRENNGLTKPTVNQEDIGESLHPVVEGTVDRNMIDVFLGLILQVLGKIDLFPIFLEISVSHLLDPSWSGG